MIGYGAAMSEMIDRRQFLVKSAASMSVPIFAHPLTAVAGRNRLPFDTVIVDERIGGDEALSRVARASGAQCVSVRGDLARLRFDSLRGACLEGSIAIAGFTSDLDSEVMRAFARDVGYREMATMPIEEAGRLGYGEYRAPTPFADDAAGAYAWNDHALMRFFETIKDTLDPNGIRRRFGRRKLPTRNSMPS